MSTIINITLPAVTQPTKPLVNITLEAFRRGYEAVQEVDHARMDDVELLELLAMIQGGTEEEIAYGVGNIVRLLEEGQKD